MSPQRSWIAQQFIDEQIVEALVRAGLTYDSPLGKVLNDTAEVTGACGTPFVRAIDEQGTSHSLDARIQQLRDDVRYRAYFPADPPVVPRTDMRKLTENFNDIITGAVAVE